MKNKWRNYALKDGKIQSSYIREYSNRSPKREASKTGYRNCFQQSGQEQAKEEIDLVQREPEYYRVGVNPVILNDAWVVNLRGKDEAVREENPSETYKEGRQGVSSSDQGRYAAQEANTKIKTGEKKVKKEKETPKAHKQHEAKESKAYEKKEDKKEQKSKKK